MPSYLSVVEGFDEYKEHRRDNWVKLGVGLGGLYLLAKILSPAQPSPAPAPSPSPSPTAAPARAGAPASYLSKWGPINGSGWANTNWNPDDGNVQVRGASWGVKPPATGTRAIWRTSRRGTAPG